MSTEVIIFIAGTVFSVIGWLLRNKDKQQEKQLDEHTAKIDLLFSKHDSDAKDLQDLRVQIAGNHYQKHEMDARFDKLETALKESIRPLSEKVDRLSDLIVEKLSA